MGQIAIPLRGDPPILWTPYAYAVVYIISMQFQLSDNEIQSSSTLKVHKL